MSCRIWAATVAATLMPRVIVRYCLDSPDGSAWGFGARITVALLFPR